MPCRTADAIIIFSNITFQLRFSGPIDKFNIKTELYYDKVELREKPPP